MIELISEKKSDFNLYMFVCRGIRLGIWRPCPSVQNIVTHLISCFTNLPLAGVSPSTLSSWFRYHGTSGVRGRMSTKLDQKIENLLADDFLGNVINNGILPESARRSDEVTSYLEHRFVTRIAGLDIWHGLRKFAIFTAAASFSLSRKIDQTLPLKGPEYVEVYTH